MHTATEFDFKFENLLEWENRSKTRHGRNKLKQLGSPLEIQKQNLVKTAVWVYHWGFSSAEVISALLGRANQSHARRLVENGWLRKVSLRGCPIYYVLTDRGLTLAQNESTFGEPLPPPHIKADNIEHDLLAQAEVIKALEDGCFHDYLTPRMYDYQGGMRKIPDAILLRHVTDEFGEKIEKTGLEVELNTKYELRLDTFATNILLDVEEQLCARYIIICGAKAVSRHYRKHFQPGNKIKLWDLTKKKPTGELYEVPSWAQKYVFFREPRSALPYIYEN